MGRLYGKTAIVTGAARGIGRAVAEVFLEQGAKVAIFDCDADAAHNTVSELDAPGRLICGIVDVSDETSVIEGVAGALAAFGTVDILVNNAAVEIREGLDATPAQWETCMAVNIMGPALMVKHVRPHMRSGGGGVIVNVGGIAGLVAEPNAMTYSASKGAMGALTRCLALDLADDNIRVNQVNPASIWTERTEERFAALGQTRDQAVFDRDGGASQMIRRAAEPREPANAVLFLASDESSFTTGSQVMVDGGWIGYRPQAESRMVDFGTLFDEPDPA